MPSREIPIALLLAVALLVVAGCQKRNVRAAPPTNSTPPATPAPARAPAANSTEAKSENPTPAPPTDIAPVPAPNTAAPPRPVPPKATPKANPPQISPRLTPEQQAVAQRKTNEDISTAERNLQVAYGKQLNATQHDLIEKVRGFLGQAREAIRASDWVRARNLAQKAMVLSVDLVNSL